MISHHRRRKTANIQVRGRIARGLLPEITDISQRNRYRKYRILGMNEASYSQIKTIRGFPTFVRVKCLEIFIAFKINIQVRI